MFVDAQWPQATTRKAHRGHARCQKKPQTFKNMCFGKCQGSLTASTAGHEGPPEGDNVSRTLQSKRTSKASKKSLTRTQRTKVHSKQHKGFQFSTSFPWGLRFMTPNCPNLKCQGSTHPQSVVSLHRVAVPYKDPGEQRQSGIPHIYIYT